MAASSTNSFDYELHVSDALAISVSKCVSGACRLGDNLNRFSLLPHRLLALYCPNFDLSVFTGCGRYLLSFEIISKKGLACVMFPQYETACFKFYRLSSCPGKLEIAKTSNNMHAFWNPVQIIDKIYRNC